MSPPTMFELVMHGRKGHPSFSFLVNQQREGGVILPIPDLVKDLEQITNPHELSESIPRLPDSGDHLRSCYSPSVYFVPDKWDLRFSNIRLQDRSRKFSIKVGDLVATRPRCAHSSTQQMIPGKIRAQLIPDPDSFRLSRRPTIQKSASLPERVESSRCTLLTCRAAPCVSTQMPTSGRGSFRISQCTRATDCASSTCQVRFRSQPASIPRGKEIEFKYSPPQSQGRNQCSEDREGKQSAQGKLSSGSASTTGHSTFPVEGIGLRPHSSREILRMKVPPSRLRGGALVAINPVDDPNPEPGTFLPVSMSTMYSSGQPHANIFAQILVPACI